ncbi:hypothetical protein JTE90_009591 [Oedothorax gibbosus]|uniref:Uncharacterized protein n=1 Tax=Oedothorax gibbosus TaxID=931172 RepID=A0AAV6VKF0_9ARAC|nr:hypothetical protein JTE90_009591 [Oedothorax gibbosus]
MFPRCLPLKSLFLNLSWNMMYMEQEVFPQTVPLMAEENAPVQEYVPMEDSSGGMFGGGEDYGAGDYYLDFG